MLCELEKLHVAPLTTTVQDIATGREIMVHKVSPLQKYKHAQYSDGQVDG